jgi:hypothetical protein
MKTNFILFCSFISFFNSFSQVFNGALMDKENSIKIPSAHIQNKTNKTYTFADSNGEFFISSKIGDTLSISHVNYEEHSFILNNIDKKKVFYLKPKVYFLKEISIVNLPSKLKSKTFGYNKGKHSLGLSLNKTYALRIKNNRQYKLKKIEIPIKINNSYKFKDKGIIKFQLFKKIDTGKVSFNPISKEHSIKLSDKNKKLIINLKNDNIIIPNEDFFIIFNRVIPNEIFNQNKNYSINPLLFFKNKGTKNDLFIKYNGSNGWVDYQDYSKKYSGVENVPSPLFSFIFTGVEINSK